MNSYCTIQIFQDNQWVDCASIELTAEESAGWHTPARTSYFMDYAADHMNQVDGRALSFNLPVNATYHHTKTWPAFLMDLLPQGFGRRELLSQLGLSVKSEESADWALLKAGAGNPIGNLRVKEAHEWLIQNFPTMPVQGFSIQEISDRDESFIESLASFGLFIAGSSGAQGEWPKLLMTQGKDGLFYLDHTLPDDQAERHWLLKFSRGADPSYNLILTQEALFMQIADYLNLRVYGVLELHNRTLFIPRFDRELKGSQVERIAQESLASLCGKAGFGVKISHNEACHMLMQCCTDPEAEILEYLKRDLANVALGNKDNHSRNTAIHRRNNGKICLTPLYDFAPMWLHPDGIARSTKWEKGDVGGKLDWHSVINQIHTECGIPVARLVETLAEQLPLYQNLMKHMRTIGIDDIIVSNCKFRVEDICQQLEEIING